MFFKKRRQPSEEKTESSVLLNDWEISVFKEQTGWCTVSWADNKLVFEVQEPSRRTESPEIYHSTKLRFTNKNSKKTYQFSIFLTDEQWLNRAKKHQTLEEESCIEALRKERWFEEEVWGELASGLRISFSTPNEAGEILDPVTHVPLFKEESFTIYSTEKNISFTVFNSSLIEFIPMALLVFYRQRKDKDAWFTYMNYAMKKKEGSVNA